MAEQQNPRTTEPNMSDPTAYSRTMADIAARSQRIVAEWLDRQREVDVAIDPLNIGSAFMEMMAKLMSNPSMLIDAQLGFWQDYVTLWQHSTRRMMGLETAPVVPPDPRDKRFQHEEWKENEIFDFIRQSYLLSARFVQDVVRRVDGLDPKTRDLEAGRGQLHIRMTDAEAFSVGGNIAVTPGKVVFRNELMELIQYTPATQTVRKTPLVIFPPWINKFYILDLRPKNSFIRWAVEQGHTVFVASWVNPDERLAEKDFADYMKLGVFAALGAIEQATGERQVNAIGYCLGGTLLAATLAVMARRRDNRIKSATFLVTLTDFADVGELGVFIDEEQLVALEEKMNRRGYLEGSAMATTFNMLRSNDLIWSFVVNNYLLGNETFPFDLLYWNSDSTRMPAAMHSFYLRNMYQKNLLSQKDAITLDGTPVDLRRVKVPVYFLSCREDHIAPWASTYRATQMMAGPKRFVLAASGHIAGVINPPDSGKYNHFVNATLPTSPEDWFAGATEVAGSWWPDWQRWIAAQGSEQVPARGPGDGALPALTDAPGNYVKVRSA
ncbi:MAG: class I poly(R)-hydroxyalkanoic acid synthase [Acidiphilium sp. 37-67-22]|nr:MAG: class I poly(R)-hydroxyalkanoic acid synthase [Acidiphilium sp. 37-67-22]